MESQSFDINSDYQRKSEYKVTEIERKFEMNTSHKNLAEAQAFMEADPLALPSGSNTILGSNESHICSTNKVIIKSEPRTPESLEEVESTAFIERCQLDEIFNRLTSIEIQLKTIQENQKQILAVLRPQYHVPEEAPQSDSFDVKYNTNLPCKTLNEFFELNDKLKENDACSYDLSNLLRFCTDGTGGIGRTTSQILKLCMTREVALSLTAQKQRPNKVVMKSMPIYNIFSNILKYMHNASEKNILSAIGDSLNNSKDWDGHRRKRARREEEEAIKMESAVTFQNIFHSS